MVRIAQCKTCEARIVWMKTLEGKNMPVNAESVDEGNLEWTDGPFGDVPIFDPDEHESHFATCEQADEHRRRR